LFSNRILLIVSISVFLLLLIPVFALYVGITIFPSLGTTSFSFLQFIEMPRFGRHVHMIGAVVALDAVVAGVFTVPGDGMVDFPAVLRELPGYSGWLVVEAEQDPAKAHPLT
jgi:hypothetical protein